MQVKQLLFAFLVMAPLLVEGAFSQGAPSSSNQQLGNNQGDCFPGLVYDAAKNSCLCANATLFFQGFVCKEGQPQERVTSFCVTSDWENPEQVVGGVCPYALFRKVTLPQWKLSQEDMNSLYCQNLHRTQTLCGRCAENYSLAINSYSFQCLPSKQCKTANILTIFLITFGPLTVFYCLIFLLQVNVASSYMFPYVLLAQTISLYILYIQSGLIAVLRGYSMAETPTKVLVSFYNIWNLDVLSLFMPPICISDHITNALAISLQYLSLIHI